jgi:transcriptional regulator with XRE-family HTH domain
VPKNNSDMYSASEQKVIRELGIRVRQLRDEAGLSQERLAELAEMHRTYISSIERGQQNISLTILIRLATALEVSLERLFTGI